MLAGFFLAGFPLDQEHLANVREVEVGIERRIERRTAPNAARLDAAMVGRCDLDDISGIALLEQPPDIAFQRGRVTRYREMIVRRLLDEVEGPCAWGQQGIARDVLSRDVTGFKQRDRLANLLSALMLITTGYG